VKTAKAANGDRSEMALLGPSFPHEISAPHLVGWEGVTCVSFGQKYSVLLPTKPSAWSENAPPKEMLCLAKAGEHLYVRVNGDRDGRRFSPCYVELLTGAVVERNLAPTTAYACEWEFVIPSTDTPVRSILKFPYE
jgi:hypothetical protein